MTLFQHFWVTVWNFGPAIIIGIYKEWWMGIIALLAGYLFGGAINWAIFLNLPLSANALPVIGYLTPPATAIAVLFIAFQF